MIDMALLSVLRRWHFREGMPIREITCRTELSRNTVRKYVSAKSNITYAALSSSGCGLNGNKASMSSIQVALGRSVKTFFRYAYGSSPLAFAVSIRLYRLLLALAPDTVSLNRLFLRPITNGRIVMVK